MHLNGGCMCQVEPENHEMVSVFFADVVGYTDMCSTLPPDKVGKFLHEYLSVYNLHGQSVKGDKFKADNLRALIQLSFDEGVWSIALRETWGQ